MGISKPLSGLALLLLFVPAQAAVADDGRLPGTGGITNIDGSAGGGITTWAVMSGYGSETGSGGALGLNFVSTGDYQLDAVGASWSFANRVEISASRQNLDLGSLDLLVLGQGDATLSQDIIGLKLRIAGDLIYSPWGQFAAGLQQRRLDDDSLPLALGAADDSGLDYQLAWTKLWLGAAGGYNLLGHVGLRSTEANENGLLGFGGNEGRETVAEAAIALLLDRKTVVGMEFREKPSGLPGLGESNWRDIFIAYLPSRQVAFTLAWADLGTVATLDDQTGFYLSVQASF